MVDAKECRFVPNMDMLRHLSPTHYTNELRIRAHAQNEFLKGGHVMIHGYRAYHGIQSNCHIMDVVVLCQSGQSQSGTRASTSS